MTEAQNPGGSGYTDELREHEFDGIQEFDNRLPNWWLWTFYLACIFSFFYWVHYHVLGTGPLSNQEYQAEMAAAEANLKQAALLSDDELLAMSQDQGELAAGKAVFEANCVACHMAHGGSMPGGVGPNLTDSFWIHGGSPTQIHKTVTEGVVEKGMLAWEPILGATKVNQVVAYVLTLRGTEVEGGKEPQGDPYEGK